jgi:hypothetical protein
MASLVFVGPRSYIRFVMPSVHLLPGLPIGLPRRQIAPNTTKSAWF